MNVLMITGDTRFGSGNPRYDLQASAVEKLEVLYWGRGQLFPRIPQGHFDVITAQDPLWRGAVAWFVARKCGAKLNVQAHMDLSTLGIIQGVLARMVLRRADTIRTVSEKIKMQVERMNVQAKITVLPVFVDIDTFRNAGRKAHTGKNILWIGRFEKEKNPLQAIEVLKEVLKTIPDAKLMMLGSGTMKEQIEEEGVDLPVDILGWQDPTAHLQVADVVISTSFYESWGASIVESLAVGVPVVSPDVGVAKEAGAIVVPREKLADEVIKVLKNGGNGVLKLSLLPASEWAVQWKQTLV